MRALNRLHARLAGMARSCAGFAAEPEPQAGGSYARGLGILNGELLLAGQRVALGEGGALFGQQGRPQAVEAAVQGFGWLGDLAALGNSAATARARAWTLDWLRLYGTGRGPGWTPDLTGRRLLALIDNAVFLTGALPGAAEPAAGAPRTTQRAGKRPRSGAGLDTELPRALARQTLFLGRRWQTALPGRPRIEALSGLLAAALSLTGMERFAAPAARALAREAGWLIDHEGGIPSRNPEELLELFTLLTRSAAALAAAGQSPGPEHRAALERMAPTLRALRHANGALARFHGGGSGAEGQLDQMLAASGVRSPAGTGLAMGYLRLSHGRSSLILDAAAPPQGAASRDAHASTLAFELTSGRRPLVVSCGPGGGFGPDWRQASRATASHSVLEITGCSSSRFGRLRGGQISELLAEVPGDVRIQRTGDEATTEITATHDGYVGTHGLTHMRRLSFGLDGRALLGEDSLAAVKTGHGQIFDAALKREGPDGIRYALRFHLHPDVGVEPDPSGAFVMLRLLSGESWRFRHDGAARLVIEASAWLDPERLRPVATKQLVLLGSVIDYSGRIRWSLAKTRDTPLSTRDLRRSDTPWLDGAGPDRPGPGGN